MNREGKQLQGRYWVDDGAAQLAQVVPARTLRYAGVEPRRLPWRQVWNVPAPGASMRSRYSTVVRHLEVNPRTAFGDRDGMPHWFDIRPIISPTMSKTKWTCEPDESKLRAFHKADRQPPADEGWPMVRGILAGAVVEAELLRWAKREGLSVDLGAAIDTQLVRQQIGRRLAGDRIAALRSDVLVMVRHWQEQFPDTNDGLAWEVAAQGMDPQTDLIVVRQRNEPVFGLRVRPDIVVRLDDCLVAVEISSAKRPDAVSSSRIALNHFALLATVERTPELRGQIHRVGTRVELLAQRTGYTRFLGADEAAEWHSAIINAAMDYLTSDTAPRRGPWCNRSPHFAPCQMMELDAMSEMEF